MANQQQALALPELLEHILLRLPMRDLLFAQKVCRDWQQAINSSPSIQKALCFRRGTQADVAGDPVYDLPSPLTASGFAPNQLLLRYYVPDDDYLYFEERRAEDLEEDSEKIHTHKDERGEDLICVDERHFSPEASCRPPFSVDFRCDRTKEEWLQQEYSEEAYRARGFKRWNVPLEPVSETMTVEISDGQTFEALLDALVEEVKQEYGLRGPTWSYGWVQLGEGWEWTGNGMKWKRTVEDRQGQNVKDRIQD
ncbi:hypothetical protein LTR17_006934 [Elasticomyces elasticus]|nr:hypothetical protein LTR17_006934 [Elasticomyces elasticus]